MNYINKKKIKDKFGKKKKNRNLNILNKSLIDLYTKM